MAFGCRNQGKSRRISIRITGTGYRFKPCIFWKLLSSRFDVSTVVMIQVEVFWVVTPFISPWRWWQQGLPKRWYPAATLQSVIAKKTSTCTFMNLWLDTGTNLLLSSIAGLEKQYSFENTNITQYRDFEWMILLYKVAVFFRSFSFKQYRIILGVN